MKTIIGKVWKILIILAVLIGLALQGGIMEGHFKLSMFRMFTTLSNVYVLLYFLAAVIFEKKNKVFASGWLFSAMLSIALTGLVAAFMLGPMFAHASKEMKAGLFFLHDFVPVAVWLDWIIFESKGSYRKYYPLIGMIPALTYVITAFLTAAFGHGLGMGDNRFPYPFLNIDQLGIPKVAITCVILASAVFGLGCLLRFLDKLIANKRSK